MAEENSDEGLESLPIITREDGEYNEETEYDEVSGQPQGLGVFMTAIFITGNIVGIGIVSTPKTMDSGGLWAILLLVIITLMVTYTGIILGRSWNIVQHRFIEYRGHVRYPYPALGQVSYGKKGRLMVSFWLNFNNYLVVVILLRLSAENIQHLCADINLNLPLYGWAIIIAGTLLPFTWFGKPVDFWFIGVGAFIVVCVSCVLLLANTTLDWFQNDHKTVIHSEITVFGIIDAISKMTFALGAHPSFPTLQNDMQQPRRFGVSVIISFIVSLLMYLSVSVAAYYVYGKEVSDNILMAVSHGPMLYIVQILITAHILLAFVIWLNPVSQEVEELIRIPKDFTWKRCLSRTILVASATTLAITVPGLGILISIVGGLSLSILTYVFPVLIYLKLCDMEGTWTKQTISLPARIFNYIMLISGIIFGISCTYVAVRNVFISHHDVPHNSTNITTF